MKVENQDFLNVSSRDSNWYPNRTTTENPGKTINRALVSEHSFSHDVIDIANKIITSSLG